MKICDLFGKESGLLLSETGSERLELIAPKHEEGACLLVRNGGSDEVVVTVKAGNSIYATNDLVAAAGGGETLAISLKNTGRFKNVSGEFSGKIIIEMSGGYEYAEVCALYL